MKPLTVGDLSWAFQLQRRSTSLKSEMTTLLTDLSSGVKSDLSGAVYGDFKGLSGIQGSISRAEAYLTVANEAAGLASTMQAALEVVQTNAGDVAGPLVTAGSSGSGPLAESAGRDAEERFKSVIGSLNSSFAERSLFAGVATDSPALASGDAILAALQTAVAGLTNAEDIETTLDTWFGPGGDFETVAYLGATTAMSPFSIGADMEADLGFTANDARLREVLKGFALGALINQGPLMGDSREQIELAAISGRVLLGSDSGLSLFRADIGAVEASIDRSITQNETEISSLEIARAEIVAIDPYEAATRLEAVQTQLESVYALTVRASQLSLMDYI